MASTVKLNLERYCPKKIIGVMIIKFCLVTQQGREQSRQWLFRKVTVDATKHMNICNLPMDGSAVSTKMTGIKKHTEGELVTKAKNPKVALKESLAQKLHQLLCTKAGKSNPSSASGSVSASEPEPGPDPGKLEEEDVGKASLKKRNALFELCCRIEWQSGCH